MLWTYQSGNWVLFPPNPKAILHFLGGAFVATVPHTTYQRLLSTMAQQGYGIIATPFIVQLDHSAIVADIYRQFNRTYQALTQQDSRLKILPIYGLGHSMGCKLHLLLSCLYSVPRQGNMLLSFNNFSGEKSIPFADWFRETAPIEITPSPQMMLNLVQSDYSVSKNFLIKFRVDDLDETLGLASILKHKFSDQVIQTQLSGSHLTPLGQDFQTALPLKDSPLEDLGQWVHQTVYRDISHLEHTLLQWLNQH